MMSNRTRYSTIEQSDLDHDDTSKLRTTCSPFSNFPSKWAPARAGPCTSTCVRPPIEFPATGLEVPATRDPHGCQVTEGSGDTKRLQEKSGS